MARFPEIAGVGEDPQRPGIVHRLDKETAGVIVVARTQAGYDHLKSQFKNRQVEKTYLALVESALDKDHGVIKGYMKRSSHIPVKRELDDEAEGKFSQTTYRVLEKVGDCTLVEAKPQTGRMHQLRVHFSALGHPIVGDTLYGRREQPGPLMLLAWKIRFKDSGGVWREYEVPVDSNFAS
jgi:23S rRNA pseudouridine1911/1915/1917 synthase